MRLLTIAAAAALAAAPLNAQNTPAAAAARPDGWRVRFDRPGTSDSALTLAAMAPGWHMTTTGRGSAIAWQPTAMARGNFTAEIEAFLFPARGGHAEGFGMIFGGRDLDGAAQSYYYFLVRGDGQFLVKHRAGAETHDLVPWTASSAVTQQEGQANAKNILTVRAAADSVVLSVNGTRVHAMARRPDMAGLVGIRINHLLDVHVSRVDVR